MREIRFGFLDHLDIFSIPTQVAARIVELYLLGKEDAIELARREAVTEFPEIGQELKEVQQHLGVDHVDAVGMLFGRPCYNPGSFLGAVHAVLTSSGYEEAVRKTILAGGCNCSRAFFIGAMIGARDGLAGLPRDWIEKTTGADIVLQLALQIAK